MGSFMAMAIQSPKSMATTTIVVYINNYNDKIKGHFTKNHSWLILKSSCETPSLSTFENIFFNEWKFTIETFNLTSKLKFKIIPRNFSKTCQTNLEFVKWGKIIWKLYHIVLIFSFSSTLINNTESVSNIMRIGIYM